MTVDEGLAMARAAGLDRLDAQLLLAHLSGRSRVWLRVCETERLVQVESQLRKLHDVRAVRRHPPDHPVFGGLEGFFRG